MQKYHERICPEHQEEADGKVDCDVAESLPLLPPPRRGPLVVGNLLWAWVLVDLTGRSFTPVSLCGL